MDKGQTPVTQIYIELVIWTFIHFSRWHYVYKCCPVWLATHLKYGDLNRCYYTTKWYTDDGLFWMLLHWFREASARRFDRINTVCKQKFRELRRNVHIDVRPYITDCGDWTTPRNYSEWVLEQASTERNNRSNPSDLPAKFLCPSQPRSFWVVHLVIDVCLSKWEYRHQWSPMRQ